MGVIVITTLRAPNLRANSLRSLKLTGTPCNGPLSSFVAAKWTSSSPAVFNASENNTWKPSCQGDSVGIKIEHAHTFRNTVRLIVGSYGRLDERGHDLRGCPSTLLDCLNNLARCEVSEQSTRTAEIRRTARRRNVLFLLGQLSGGESSSLSDCFFSFGAFGVDDDFVRHCARWQPKRGKQSWTALPPCVSTLN